jgi:hypothetical protein
VLRVFTNLLRLMRLQNLSRYESSLEIVYASIGQSFTTPGIENPRNVRTPRRLDISYIFSKPCCSKQRALLLSQCLLYNPCREEGAAKKRGKFQHHVYKGQRCGGDFSVKMLSSDTFTPICYAHSVECFCPKPVPPMMVLEALKPIREYYLMHVQIKITELESVFDTSTWPSSKSQHL